MSQEGAQIAVVNSSCMTQQGLLTRPAPPLITFLLLFFCFFCWISATNVVSCQFSVHAAAGEYWSMQSTPLDTPLQKIPGEETEYLHALDRVWKSMATKSFKMVPTPCLLMPIAMTSVTIPCYVHRCQLFQNQYRDNG